MKPSKVSCLVAAAIAVCIILGLAVPTSASSLSAGALGACVYPKPHLIFHEFFWFATDALGHLKGIEAQKVSVARFDGVLRPVLDYVRRSPDDVNVVLYFDHGMSMIEENVDTEAAMAEVAVERAVFCFYSKMYLADPLRAPEVGRDSAARYEVDFPFWREGDALTVGGHDHGTVLFDYDDEHVSYTYLEDDPFGYYDLGYRGERLTDAEWLKLTCRSSWPRFRYRSFDICRLRRAAMWWQSPTLPRVCRVQKGT